MKNLILLLLLIPALIFSQETRVFIKTDSAITVIWEHQKDIETDSIWFNVYIVKNYEDTTIVSVPDTFIHISDWGSPGIYVFGVSAVNQYGQESRIVWSWDCNDPNMDGVCWHIAYKVGELFPVRRLRIRF
jgi:hypothetical protein